MRDVAIIGADMIPFGRRDEDSLMDMLAYASLKALDDAGLGDKSVDAVYVDRLFLVRERGFDLGHKPG